MMLFRRRLVIIASGYQTGYVSKSFKRILNISAYLARSCVSWLPSQFNQSTLSLDGVDDEYCKWPLIDRR